MMKMLRAPRVEPPLESQMDFGRVASGLGWVAFGALAVGVTAQALLRSKRSPSTGDEPDGQEPEAQEPDVLLDVTELEVDRITLEVEDLRAHVAILEKALDTIAEHPEILRILARSLSQVVRESLEETLGNLDSVLEGLEVGDTVDEALRGRLEEVRATLEEILERSERGVEGAAQRTLGEGPGDDTTVSP